MFLQLCARWAVAVLTLSAVGRIAGLSVGHVSDYSVQKQERWGRDPLLVGRGRWSSDPLLLSALIYSPSHSPGQQVREAERALRAQKSALFSPALTPPSPVALRKGPHQPRGSEGRTRPYYFSSKRPYAFTGFMIWQETEKFPLVRPGSAQTLTPPRRAVMETRPHHPVIRRRAGTFDLAAFSSPAAHRHTQVRKRVPLGAIRRRSGLRRYRPVASSEVTGSATFRKTGKGRSTRKT